MNRSARIIDDEPLVFVSRKQRAIDAALAIEKLFPGRKFSTVPICPPMIANGHYKNVNRIPEEPAIYDPFAIGEVFGSITLGS